MKPAGDLNVLSDSATDLGATVGFGLMFYREASRAKRVDNARWPRSVPVAKRRGHDPMTGRFAQADTDVPASQGVQALDRYAYANNNPSKYTDPSGHEACMDFDEYGNCIPEPEVFVVIICGVWNGHDCANGDGSSLDEYGKWARGQGYHVKTFDADDCLDENPDAYKATCAGHISDYMEAHPGNYILIGHSAGADIAIATAYDTRGMRNSVITTIVLLDPTMTATGYGEDTSLYNEAATLVSAGITIFLADTAQDSILVDIPGAVKPYAGDPATGNLLFDLQVSPTTLNYTHKNLALSVDVATYITDVFLGSYYYSGH